MKPLDIFLRASALIVLMVYALGVPLALGKFGVVTLRADSLLPFEIVGLAFTVCFLFADLTVSILRK